MSYEHAVAGVTVDLKTPNNNSGDDALGDIYIRIEHVKGSKKSDMLIGDENANALWGDLGDDTLEGGLGADTLDGGTVAANDANNTVSYARSLEDNGGGIEGVKVNLADASQNDGIYAKGDTSDDEPVQLLTPDSAVPSETAADAQAGIASADLQALEGEDSQSTRLHTETLQTQSTGFDMAALLAGNLSASLNWQTPLTQRPDAQIAVKLPGVNLPVPPVLFPLSSSLTYPKGSNNLAVNKAMVLSGYSVQGQAPSNSSVTLVLKYGESVLTHPDQHPDNSQRALIRPFSSL